MIGRIARKTSGGPCIGGSPYEEQRISKVAREADRHAQNAMIRKDGGISVAIEGHSNAEVNYHMLLLKDAGFVEAAVQRSDEGVMVQPLRLTWSGHEFIDSARSSKVWDGAKAFALKRTGTSTLEGMKLAIPHVMRALIGG
jgi:hypothetical protein